MHPCARLRRRLALVRPLLLDLFRGHSIVLRLIPLRRTHHLGDTRIRVEVTEEVVEEAGTTRPALSRTVNRVGVCLLLELDAVIPRMPVEDSQALPGQGSIGDRLRHVLCLSYQGMGWGLTHITFVCWPTYSTFTHA